MGMDSIDKCLNSAVEWKDLNVGERVFSARWKFTAPPPYVIVPRFLQPN